MTWINWKENMQYKEVSFEITEYELTTTCNIDQIEEKKDCFYIYDYINIYTKRKYDMIIPKSKIISIGLTKKED